MKKYLLIGLTLIALISALNQTSAVNLDWKLYNNVTIVAGAYDTFAATTFNGTAGIWCENLQEAIANPNGTVALIIDRTNVTILGNYWTVNVTYNISGPTAPNNAEAFNITHISIELMANIGEVNLTAANLPVYWNTSNVTAAATTVADTDSDTYYEANYTFATHTEGWYENSLWRQPTIGATENSTNITLTQRIVIKTETAKYNAVEYSDGEAGPNAIFVIGLGAAGNQVYVLVNHTFNISQGSPWVNLSNVNVTYYIPVDPVDNNTIQVFLDNESFGGAQEWTNWSARATNFSIGATSRTIQWNYTGQGFGQTRSTPLGTSGNDTTNWRVQYAIYGPYMSRNTSIRKGADTKDADTELHREFDVIMNNTDFLTDVHNVTLRYNINDELYDYDFKLEVWSDNVSRWFDITPQKDCTPKSGHTEQSSFSVYGENWKSCYYDTDNDDKPNAVNVTIPSMSTRKFKITASADPGRQYYVAPGVSQECGDGVCGPDEPNRCERDCQPGMPQQQQPSSYTPGSAWRREMPDIPLPWIVIGIATLVILAIAFTRRK